MITLNTEQVNTVVNGVLDNKSIEFDELQIEAEYDNGRLCGLSGWQYNNLSEDWDEVEIDSKSVENVIECL